MVIKKSIENVELLLSAIVVLSFLGLAQVYQTPFEWKSNLLFFTLFIICLIITANFIRQRLRNCRGSCQAIWTPIKDWSPLLAIIVSYMNYFELKMNFIFDDCNIIQKVTKSLCRVPRCFYSNKRIVRNFI